jgi:hypothetical protein
MTVGDRNGTGLTLTGREDWVLRKVVRVTFGRWQVEVADVQRVCDATSGFRLGQAVELAIGGGLRRGAVLGAALAEAVDERLPTEGV